MGCFMGEFEVIRLATRAVKRLTDRSVEIRFRRPARRDAVAMCHRSGGRLFIDISPGLDDRAFLNSLCHEAAHMKLHAVDFVDLPDFESGRLSPPADLKNRPAIRRQESEAEKLASTWLSYCEQASKRYPGGWLEKRLTALLNYFPPEVQKIIDKAAAVGALQAIKGISERR